MQDLLAVKHEEIEKVYDYFTNGEFPIFEPWFMTEEEFEFLPEFEGF